MAVARFDDRGVVVVCPSCSQSNRIRYERLAEPARCGKCGHVLAPPGEPVEIGTAADFDRLVSRASIPIVVDYWAPWCGPCRIVAPELEKVAARSVGRLFVVKVNTDALPELGERFQIRSIPTLAVFVEGREAARTSGARPAADIESFISQAADAFHGRPKG
jgi:thioredoxin 2